jgi:hypothetical protein
MTSTRVIARPFHKAEAPICSPRLAGKDTRGSSERIARNIAIDDHHPYSVTKLLLATGATVLLTAASAFAEMETLTKDVRFCPSWAEAHERTLASLNGGRPPYPVKWKGCIVLKQGRKVNVIDHDDQSTEILVNGKHWFADE